jgi:hypothetical protein
VISAFNDLDQDFNFTESNAKIVDTIQKEVIRRENNNSEKVDGMTYVLIFSRL